MNSRIRPVLFVLCMIPALWNACAATTVYKERARTYHVIHYALDIRVDEVRERIEGTVGMTVVPLKPLLGLDVDADAASMTIGSVRLRKAGGETLVLGHRLRGESLTITLPQVMTPADTLSLLIAYACTPRNGLHFIRPDSLYPDLPAQVWSQGEMQDNHFWFPCYDYPNDKATCEMHVTVNEKLVAISNGALLEVTPHAAEKTKTYFWFSAKPFSSYLISLVVGDYVKIDDHYGHIPLEYWVYPSQREEALRSFAATPAMMRFYADRLGYDFPWQKYAQTVVSCFTYGGMENVSAATLTDRTIHDARAHLAESSEHLVAHELAHQWFGDLLTCRNWSHAWLNEGFATYFQSLYDEASSGWDEFEYEMMSQQQSIVNADTGIERRPTVTNAYDDPEDMFDSRIYARGSAILHMLRFVLGDQAFWKGMRHYVDLHQYGSVTTDDFERAMEESSAQDLRWFFEEWTVHAGYPSFRIAAEYDSAARMIHLAVAQTQRADSLTPLFRMPVAVEVTGSRGSTLHRVFVEAKRDQRIDIPSAERPVDVVFDKGSWILKKLLFLKPESAVLFELAHGDVGERDAALRELAVWVDDPAVQEAIRHALAADPFWGVRRSAAEVMGVSDDSAAIPFLISALADSDARVRVAVCSALKGAPGENVVPALRRVLAEDSSYSVAAQAVASLIVTDTGRAMQYVEQALRMDSHNDVIRAAAVRALGITRTGSAERKLLGWTADGVSRDVRVAAIDALVENWRTSDTVRLRMEELTADRFHQIRRAAIEKLAVIASPASRKILGGIVKTEPSGILRREARKALLRIQREVRNPGAG